MKLTYGYFVLRRLTLLLSLIAWVLPAGGGERFHLASGLDPAQPASAGGSGDSWAPIMSADGRFVLFASTANNLSLNRVLSHWHFVRRQCRQDVGRVAGQ